MLSSTSSFSHNKTYKNDEISQNVFVTQINEREGEIFPKNYIIKETPEILLKTGLNTFQDTLVVRKEGELSCVDAELTQHRQNYEGLMSQFKKKRQDLMIKQQGFMDQMKTFDSFIKENESKRRRALAKYQSEVRLLEYQKGITLELEQDISNIKLLHEKLLKKVQRNKKYEEFLIKVIESLPSDYIKVSDNILGGLIMRYNTLHSTNEALVADMINKSEEGNRYGTSISKLKQSHDNEILQSNYLLSMMYEKHEELKDQIQTEEQMFRLKFGENRKKLLDFGLTERAVDNITRKCARKFDQTIDNNDLDRKMEKIQDYIKTSRQIIEAVEQMKDDKPTGLVPQNPNKTTMKSTNEAPNKIVKKARTVSGHSKLAK